MFSGAVGRHGEDIYYKLTLRAVKDLEVYYSNLCRMSPQEQRDLFTSFKEYVQVMLLEMYIHLPKTAMRFVSPEVEILSDIELTSFRSLHHESDSDIDSIFDGDVYSEEFSEFMAHPLIRKKTQLDEMDASTDLNTLFPRGFSAFKKFIVDAYSGQDNDLLSIEVPALMTTFDQLVYAIRLTPPGDIRIQLALTHASAISNKRQWGTLVECFPKGMDRDRLILDRISWIDSDVDFHRYLDQLFSVDSKLQCVEAKKDLIQSARLLTETLRLLPPGEARVNLVLNKINLVAETDLDQLLPLLPPNLEEKLPNAWQSAYKAACSATLKMNDLQDPLILQGIHIGKINPNYALFDAVFMRDQRRFLTFLRHALCDPLALNQRGQRLCDVIREVFMEHHEEGRQWLMWLDDEILKRRKAHSEACIFIHCEKLPTVFGFSKVIGMDARERLEADGVVEHQGVVEDPGILEGQGVLESKADFASCPRTLDPKDWARFQALIDVFLQDVRLAPQNVLFVELRKNTKIYISEPFRMIILELQVLRFHLECYFEKNSTETVWRYVGHPVDWSYCPAGVISLLRELNSAFVEPGLSRISERVLDYIKTGLYVCAEISFIGVGMHIHSPLTASGHGLGLEVLSMYDPHALTIESFARHVIASFVGSVFDIQVVIDALLPDGISTIESRMGQTIDVRTDELLPVVRGMVKDLDRIHYFPKEASEHLLNPEEREALELRRMAHLLLQIGELKNTKKGSDSVSAPVSDPVSDAEDLINRVIMGCEDIYENEAQCVIDEEKVSSWKAQLRDSSEKALVEIGLIPTQERVKQQSQMVWEILIHPEPDMLSDAHRKLWVHVMNAPDGLGFVKRLIEAHSGDPDRISIQSLVWRPEGCEKSLFQAFGAHPLFSGWFLGYRMDILREDEVRTYMFSRTESLLDAQVGPIDPAVRARELARLLLEPGAFMYWAAELGCGRWSMLGDYLLQECVDTSTSYVLNVTSVMSHCHRISISQDDLMGRERALKSTAVAFLNEQLQHQRELELWDCYWNTACYVTGFKMDWHVFETPSAVESLSDLKCMQAFWYAIQGNRREIESADCDESVKSILLSKVDAFLKSFETFQRVATVIQQRDFQQACGLPEPGIS